MEDKKEFKYQIGGKVYFQRPLVLGQIQQLLRMMKGVAVPASSTTADIIRLLGERTSEALAIVLIPDGVRLRDRDLAAIQTDIEEAIMPEHAVQVIEDFFICTPLVSLIERLGSLAGVIQQQTKITLNKSSSASAVQT